MSRSSHRPLLVLAVAACSELDGLSRDDVAKFNDDQRAGVDLGQAHIDRAVCHVPAMRTRADYPIAQIAGIDAPIYSDLLLHDMGAALADGMTDGGAGPRAWRTAPLIGMRFQAGYLHDGRAPSVAEAVVAHDGEARGAATRVRGAVRGRPARVDRVCRSLVRTT